MIEQEWINNLPYSFIHDESNREIFLAFVEDFGIEKMYKGTPIWPKMYGKKFVKITELSEYESFPSVRQQEMYERYDRSRVLVVHFYENINQDELEDDLYVFAYERGLSIDWLAYDESWYNPGVSLTALFEIVDYEKYENYINFHKQYDGKLNRHYI
jgi:hypothetical protein